MTKKARETGPKIVWRGGTESDRATARAYLDLRAARFGGAGFVALIPEGETRATTDRATAERLAAAMLANRQAEQQQAERLGLRRELGLRDYANRHLEAKTKAGRFSALWLLNLATYLDRAVVYFDVVQAAQADTAAERRRTAGPRNLATISAPDVSAFAEWLGTQQSGRRGGATLGQQSVRHHLSALSGVFARAVAQGHLPANPVAALVDRPSVPKSRTRLLQPWETALLLESARTLPREGRNGRAPLACAHALLAFYAYTGARENEARSMDVQDVDFTRGELHLRGTKTSGSDRYVPLHPPLRALLVDHVRTLGRLSGPLFPGYRSERFGSWSKTLDSIAARAGFTRGEVRSRNLRVTYASDRLTCDGVDVQTVRQELGHTSLALLDRVYARSQRRADRMGAGGMEYSLARWACPELAERVQQMGAAPASAPERADVVHTFLASVAHLGVKRAESETGVPYAVVQRLRAGRASTVKGKTLDRMLAHLRTVERQPREQQPDGACSRRIA
jgi:integrase